MTKSRPANAQIAVDTDASAVWCAFRALEREDGMIHRSPKEQTRQEQCDLCLRHWQSLKPIVHPHVTYLETLCVTDLVTGPRIGYTSTDAKWYSKSEARYVVQVVKRPQSY